MKRLVHALAPRGAVNFAWNLAADLAELPARRRDPRPRPWRVLHNVGGGEFYKTGEDFFTLFQDGVDLKPGASVLDIGCGAGRMAFPICAALNETGRYIGFDIAPGALAFARRHVRGDCAIPFHHADLANREYARRGAPAEAYVFPADDASVDAAIATSVFSHILPGAAERYLAETGRVLRQGGRIMLTAFLVREADHTTLSTARLALKPFSETGYAVDARHPERAMGFDEAAFLHWAHSAGLRLAGPVHRGDWREAEAGGGEFQDRLVLQKI